MGVRQFIERSNREIDSGDLLRDNHRKVAQEQLVPRMIERMKIAVGTDRRMVHYYQRRQQGRRCSCTGAEASPNGTCTVCYGTGIVAGYERWGCATHIVDVTSPNTTLVNVRPAFERRQRPTLLTLDEYATIGFLETTIEVRRGIRVVDLVQTVATTANGNSVIAYIKAPSEQQWTALTERSLEPRLGEHQLGIRVELRRADATKPLPMLSHVMLRYLLRHDVQIPIDIAQETRSVILQEMGVEGSFTTVSAVVPNILTNITTDDFFRRVDDGTRWKVTEVTPRRPFGKLVVHDLLLRGIRDFEDYNLVP